MRDKTQMAVLNPYMSISQGGHTGYLTQKDNASQVSLTYAPLYALSQPPIEDIHGNLHSGTTVNLSSLSLVDVQGRRLCNYSCHNQIYIAS